MLFPPPECPSSSLTIKSQCSVQVQLLCEGFPVPALESELPPPSPWAHFEAPKGRASGLGQGMDPPSVQSVRISKLAQLQLLPSPHPIVSNTRADTAGFTLLHIRCSLMLYSQPPPAVFAGPSGLVLSLWHPGGSGGATARTGLTIDKGTQAPRWTPALSKHYSLDWGQPVSNDPQSISALPYP